MSERKSLPNRRLASTVEFDHRAGETVMRFRVTFGRFVDGTPAELFVNASRKVDSFADTNACDAAIFASLALQYGCPIDVLRDAAKRNADGSAMGPVGHALDIACEDKT